MEKVNLADEAARLTEFWSQRVLASGNDNLFKVAKGIGSTNWHTHEDQDEVFLLIEGHLTIQMRDRNVELGPGELFVIPRGTEHCPLANEEARFLLVGPEVTSNAAGGKPDWSYADLGGHGEASGPASFRSTTMSSMSFCRHGPPLRRRGYCSFMASMPATLMASTGMPSSVPGSLPKEPGGNSQSDHRPRSRMDDPSGSRSK